METYIPTFLSTTYIPTYLHPYTRTHLHTHTPTNLHIYILTFLHTYTYPRTYIHTCIHRVLHLWKEGKKSNFRQYGQMEKQRREESKRRREERRSERRKSEKKEDAGAEKGRKVAIHCVFPMIASSGGSKNRLGKAAGAEPCSQMRDEKIARRCGAKHISKPKSKNTSHSDHFWKLNCRKSARRCGEKQFPSQKC